jgi:hypothetical protein
VTRDEAIELVLNVIEDRPSGPAGEEVLRVIQAAAWDEGADAILEDVWATSPYGADGNA